MCNYNDTTNIDVDFIYSPKKEDHYRWERISLKVSKEKGFYIKEGLRYKPFCIRDESCRLANFAYCNLIEAIVTSLDLAWNAPVLYSVGEEMCNYKAYYFPPISLNRLAGYQYVDEAIRGLTNETDSLVNYSKLPFNVGYYLALIIRFFDNTTYGTAEAA